MVNHSGGAQGADMMWEYEAAKYGIETIAYSFPGHAQESKNPHILMGKELQEGFEHVKIAEQTLHRNLTNLQSIYVKALLSRNWFQVKNSEAIYAVSSFDNYSHTIITGGTGWTVQMAIDNNKPAFVFDEPTNAWYVWSTDTKKFEFTNGRIPMLTENFGGIGSRAITDVGANAIKQILQHNLGQQNG